jgi:hypothetical protein
VTNRLLSELAVDLAEAAEHACQVLSIASLVAQAAELRARRVTVR